tara:strand:+ start:4082 stop:4429 length:348 start_codon:yes stop_codon:yes gene_type:complete
MSEENGFKHQDWNEVVLRKPIEVKNNNPSLNQKTKSQYLLESNDIIAPPKTNKELKLAIQQARIAKKWSQKELATQLNTTIQIISQYENGKAIPNNAFISKLEKKLGVKLPRIKK